MATAGDQPTLVDDEHDGDVEIHGDVLEAVFSRVPLVDLVSASHVSKSWCAAVYSSLRLRNKPRPWLILHTQATRCPHSITTRAYDPRSNVWIKISRPPVEYIPVLKSSHSTFLYMLSPSQFYFSFDPLNFNWHRVEAPLVWRRDPIVARVGNSVVVAGGGCDFENDPLAVEIYDLSTRVWHSCDSMPESLRDSAASPWLSIAATAKKLWVTVKATGVTHWFDPETKSWSEPFKLNPDQPVSSYNIGCSNSSLILVGLCRIQGVELVKVWRVGEEDLECEEMGEMPQEYVEKLRSESFGECSINIRVAGNTLYVYNSNTWEAEEVVACEFIRGGGCEWWSVRNILARDGMVADNMVFTCSEVGIDELRRVMRAENRRFEVHSVN